MTSSTALFIFGLFLLILFTLAVWRLFHLRKNHLKFIYELYRIRDQLRRAAITEKIDSEHWLFEYYDQSLSKGISKSRELTLFLLAYYQSKAQRDAKFLNFKEGLDRETKKSPVLSQIRDQYSDAVFSYVVEQHQVSLALIMWFARPIAGLYSRIKGWINRSKDGWVHPQTSVSKEFALTK